MTVKAGDRSEAYLDLLSIDPVADFAPSWNVNHRAANMCRRLMMDAKNAREHPGSSPLDKIFGKYSGPKQAYTIDSILASQFLHEGELQQPAAYQLLLPSRRSD